MKIIYNIRFVYLHLNFSSKVNAITGPSFFYRYENVFTNYIEVIIITMYSM